MPRTDFSTTEVARIAGVSYKTLDRWLTEGIVTCDVPAEGTGSRRRFTYRDTVFVFLARTLVKHDFSLPVVRGLLRALRKGWEDDDPDHAGCLMIKSWDVGTSSLWLPDATRVNEFFPSLEGSTIEQGTETGIIVVIFANIIAKQAQSQIDAARGGSPPVLLNPRSAVEG